MDTASEYWIIYRGTWHSPCRMIWLLLLPLDPRNVQKNCQRETTSWRYKGRRGWGRSQIMVLYKSFNTLWTQLAGREKNCCIVISHRIRRSVTWRSNSLFFNATIPSWCLAAFSWLILLSTKYKLNLTSFYRNLPGETLRGAAKSCGGWGAASAGGDLSVPPRRHRQPQPGRYGGGREEQQEEGGRGGLHQPPDPRGRVVAKSHCRYLSKFTILQTFQAKWHKISQLAIFC